MTTFKNKFNLKYGFDKDENHSLYELSKITNIKLSIINNAYNRGVGAWKSNPKSVRSLDGSKSKEGFSKSNRMTAEQWGLGRVYSLIMGNSKATSKGKPDSDLYELIKI